MFVKKLLLVFLFLGLILLGYKAVLIAIEGTRFDNPKIFYTEERDAIYTISVDKTAGYYFLEGTNGVPDHHSFRLPIVKTPVDLETYIPVVAHLENERTNGYTRNPFMSGEYINKKVQIYAKTGYIKISEVPCRKGWSKWCKKNQIGGELFGVQIISITKIL
ncbi:hypothetical protein BH09PAT2_BH09PAT2_04480 [soil metagenome]